MEPHTVHRRLIACAAIVLGVAGLLRAQPADVLYVATYLEVRAGAERQGAALAAQYAAATRTVPGNLRVEALQEIGRANRFVIVEAWSGEASFADHQKASQTTAFRARVEAIQRAPPDQRIHRGLDVDPTPSSAGGDAFYIVSHVDVPAARRQEAEALLKRLVEPSRRDGGHVRYDVYHQVEPRTNHFKVVAVWNGRKAFDAYGNTAHWLEFRQALGPMLGALYDERLYQAVRP
jgi:quinol monooxygenase YgiN